MKLKSDSVACFKHLKMMGEHFLHILLSAFSVMVLRNLMILEFLYGFHVLTLLSRTVLLSASTVTLKRWASLFLLKLSYHVLYGLRHSLLLFTSIKECGFRAVIAWL